MPLHLLILFGSFLAAGAELTCYNRNQMTHKSCKIYDVALYRKSLLTLAWITVAEFCSDIMDIVKDACLTYH